MTELPTFLVTSRFAEPRPDFLLLQEFEQACLRHSAWRLAEGPLLPQPTKISTRLYTLLHDLLRPFEALRRTPAHVISLGLPYRHYFFGKTFPFFTFRSGLRVLWTYDAWAPRFNHIASIAREAKLDLLLVSSSQAAEMLRAYLPSTCQIHWVPEALEVGDYTAHPWPEREIDVLAFGRSHSRFHDAVESGCAQREIRYFSQRFPSAKAFTAGLATSKISICFPRSVTHPEVAGSVSAVTLRYLQSMAAKCVVVGSAPFDAEKMFGYNPVVEVDWNDPVGQLEQILEHPETYQPLVDRNYSTLCAHHQTKNFVERVNARIAALLT